MRGWGDLSWEGGVWEDEDGVFGGCVLVVPFWCVMNNLRDSTVAILKTFCQKRTS